MHCTNCHWHCNIDSHTRSKEGTGTHVLKSQGCLLLAGSRSMPRYSWRTDAGQQGLQVCAVNQEVGKYCLHPGKRKFDKNLDFLRYKWLLLLLRICFHCKHSGSSNCIEDLLQAKLLSTSCTLRTSKCFHGHGQGEGAFCMLWLCAHCLKLFSSFPPLYYRLFINYSFTLIALCLLI